MFKSVSKAFSYLIWEYDYDVYKEQMVQDG